MFIDYGGVKVYRLYKNDDQNFPLSYHFGFSPDAPETAEHQFDVRTLPEFTDKMDLEDEDHWMSRVICDAIDNGTVKLPESLEDYEMPCSHPYAGLEVAEDEDGILYVLCSCCSAETRDLKTWVMPDSK